MRTIARSEEGTLEDILIGRLEAVREAFRVFGRVRLR
jgi:hypothetical protein